MQKKFTSEVLEAIPKWRASGATSEDIAEALGTTVGSLRVMCSQYGISLRTKTRANNSTNIHSLLRKALSAEAWAGLCVEARRREVPVLHLAFTMLEIVAVDDLYEAVIDDKHSHSEVVQKRGVNGR